MSMSATYGLGVVEVVRLAPGRWMWLRRDQSGAVVHRASEPARSRWGAERAARRENGVSLPVLRCVYQPR